MPEAQCLKVCGRSYPIQRLIAPMKLTLQPPPRKAIVRAVRSPKSCQAPGSPQFPVTS